MCATVKEKQPAHSSGDLQKEFCYQRTLVTAISKTLTLWKVRHNRCCYCLGLIGKGKKMNGNNAAYPVLCEWALLHEQQKIACNSFCVKPLFINGHILL
jgi:hypothetical protein